MPKVKAHSKNGLLQNKDGSLTPGCLTRNLQHDWSKLDLSPLEAPGWRSQLKKAGRTSELCTQNSTPGPLLSSSHRAIIRNAQTPVCRLEGCTPSSRDLRLQQEAGCFTLRTSSNGNRLDRLLKTTILMRIHFNSAKTVSSLENGVKTLPFDKAGEKACPLKPPPK